VSPSFGSPTGSKATSPKPDDIDDEDDSDVEEVSDDEDEDVGKKEDASKATGAANVNLAPPSQGVKPRQNSPKPIRQLGDVREFAAFDEPGRSPGKDSANGSANVGTNDSTPQLSRVPSSAAGNTTTAGLSSLPSLGNPSQPPLPPPPQMMMQQPMMMQQQPMFQMGMMGMGMQQPMSTSFESSFCAIEIRFKIKICIIFHRCISFLTF
jgi:hypothetical protein